MDNAIQMFRFENKQEIRVIEGEDGEPWFVASGVCKALEYANTSKALSDHVDKEDVGYITLGAGQVIGGITARYTPGSSALINESGLYSLTFASTLPEAKRFRKWVTSEVLPSIRRTGTYSLKKMSPAELLVAQAQQLLDHERRIEALEADMQAQQAKQRAAEEALSLLPEPSEPAPAKSIRASLNERVRSFVSSSGVEYTTAWGKLYKELYYRAHFDATTRTLAKGQHMLDLVEEAGLLPTLYAIAREVLS